MRRVAARVPTLRVRDCKCFRRCDQNRSMICVPDLVYICSPVGNLWVTTSEYFGLIQRVTPRSVTFFFMWTTLSCRTFGILSLYAFAPSVCSTTSRFSRCRLAIGFQSRLRIGPGPGARRFVLHGSRRVRTKVFGLPRSTNPPHCSHCTGLSWSSFSASSILPRSTSSASTSGHLSIAPNLMLFSFFLTYFILALSRRV